MTGTLYFDTNGVPGDRYFVRAVDATGNKSATTSVIVAPARADTSAPTAPTGLTGSATGATVNLSWSASNDDVGVTGYVVQRNGTDLTLAAGTTASITSSLQASSVSGATAGTSASASSRAKVCSSRICASLQRPAR